MSRMRDRIDDAAALELTGEGMIAVDEAHFPERAMDAAIAHLEGGAARQGCSASWLHARFPERVTHRARPSKYRCIRMFAAATHPDAEVRFAYEMFRGEDACWSINVQDAFVRFCSRCGQALPNHAFEPEPIA